MYNFLKYYNVKTTIVATKYDKVSMSGRAKQDKLIRDTLKLSEGETFIPFSSVTKKGREEIYSLVENALNS